MKSLTIRDLTKTYFDPYKGTHVEAVRGMILESSPEGVVAALGAMRDRPDSTELLGKIHVPTLVVSGGEDGIFPPEIMEEMARMIPGASLWQG